MTELKINYSIFTKVVKVEEAKQRVHLSGSGDAATFTTISLGWFVTFEGSYESLYFGETRPKFTVGKNVKITFTEIDDEKIQSNPQEARS